MEQEYFLETSTLKQGLYLSQQQIDLLFIVACPNKKQLEDYFYRMCGQFPYQKIEEVIPNYNELDIEQTKRALFVKYQEILIGYKENYLMSPIEQAEHKLDMMRTPEGKTIPEDIKNKALEVISNGKINEAIQYLSQTYGNEFIIKFNRLMKDDFENIKSISYEDIEALHERINTDDRIDTIIIATSKYDNTIFNNGKKDYYDPYLTSKGATYCRLTNKSMRFHALFDYAHLKKLLGEGKGKEDKEEILNDMKAYVKLSLDYIRNYNQGAKKNGNKPIEIVEIFNELVEYNKIDSTPYEMVWEKYFGITINDILSCFDGIEKTDGIKFMYNETKLEEHPDRRKKISEIFNEIMQKKPDLIDVFGNQMHVQHTHAEVQSNNPNDTLKAVRESLALMADIESREYKLSDDTTKKIKTEITEFDIHISKETYLSKVVPMLKTGELTKDDITLLKRTWIQTLSDEIMKSGINPERITYWSIHDTVDHNLVRANQDIMNKNPNMTIEELEEAGMFVDTLYAGILGSGTVETKDFKPVTQNSEQLIEKEEKEPVKEEKQNLPEEQIVEKEKPKTLVYKPQKIPNSGFITEYIIIGVIATIITTLLITIINLVT